ncbi:MAG: methyl-accepting chemotaxis protein [Synergistaceae bacterium]|nr:methyl-accepting chemotaxis protein [Synergistaceae bacterium]
MRNVKIGKKLLLGFGLLLVVFVASVFLSWRDMRAVLLESDFLATGIAPSMLLNSEIERETRELFSAVDEFKLTENDDLIPAIEKSRKSIVENIDNAAKLFAVYPELIGLKQTVEKLKPAYETYDKLVADAEALVREKEANLARAAVVGQEFQDALSGKLVGDDYGKLRAFSGTDGMDQIILIQRIQDGESVITKVVNMRLSLYSSMFAQNSDGVRDVVELVNSIVEEMKSLKVLAIDSKDEENFQQLLEKAEGYRDVISAFVDSYIRLQEAHSSRAPYKATVNEESTASSLVSQNRVKAIAEETEKSLVGSIRVLWASAGIAVVLGVVVAVVIARMITNPLSSIVSIAKKAQAGDLTIGIEDFGYEGRDELGVLVSSLSEMVADQRGVLLDVVDVANRVTQLSGQLASIADESNMAMERVRGSVEEVTSLIESNSTSLQECNSSAEEVSSGADSTAHSATESASLILNMTGVASGAVKSVNALIDDINSVSDKSGTVETRIRELVTSVDSISGFVSVISGIADQTNLLALNAAIEAARAGEAGRGFAVVAEEVRKLAEESSKAAQSVDTLIETLQESSKQAISATAESGDLLRSTIKEADKAQTELSSAMHEMDKANDSIQNIAAVAQQQAASSKEITGAIDNATQSTMEIESTISVIRNDTETTASDSRRVSDCAREMAENAEQLKSVLGHFKV